MATKHIDSPLLFAMSEGPDFSVEKTLASRGIETICGVDEAGRGPLAGPVTAAAVVLNPERIPAGLDDSKKLTDKRREALFSNILEHAIVSIAHVSATEIDRLNIRTASLEAMRLAIEGIEGTVEHALIDGNALPANLPCPATAMVKGDSRSLSIAAASIIAKVTRDRLMLRADLNYPGYGFSKHKGYPTKDHRQALAMIGPSPLHRMSFAPVRSAIEN